MAVQETAIRPQQQAPPGLWVWIGLEALSFVVAPLLRPGPSLFVTSWAIFGALSALLAFGLWRRSRLAWVIGLLLSIWGVLGGLLLFPALSSGSEEIAWFAWGLGFSLGSLLALVSPGIRAWIREQPVEPADEAAVLTGSMREDRRTD